MQVTLDRKKVLLIILGTVVLIIGGGYSYLHQMGAVKGPAVELATFTDIPYEEGLGKMSESCVHDLNFDGTEDSFWFDRNYPQTIEGEYPFVVNFLVGDERIRLDSFDVKELHSFVLVDLNTNDRCCDLIISMTQGADNTKKTSVVNIPHKGQVTSLNLKELVLPKSKRLQADYWHIGEITDSKDQELCLIDGLYNGISEDGYLLIGDSRLKPDRKYTLITESQQTTNL